MTMQITAAKCSYEILFTTEIMTDKDTKN